MRTLTAIASVFALLLTTSAATAAEASVVGGIEGVLGFPGTFDFDTPLGTAEGDTETSFGLVPWVEKKLGSVVGVGGEMVFMWMTAEGAKESRLVLSPHARIRMAFPIVDKVTADAFLAGGPTIWTSGDDDNNAANDSRFGWSLRFGFGGSYAINDTVSAYGHLGWYTTTTYGDDITANMQTVPLAVGLRGNF